jgi:DNA-binding FadR family transcriptional regulator
MSPAASQEHDDTIVQALEPVEVPAAFDVVAGRLRRAIQLGSYITGDRLPSERALSEQLGVSRVTLREALRVLEGEGLITRTRGSSGGSTIGATSTSAQEIRERLRGRRDEMLAALEFRAVVESAAAELAAERRTDDDLARIAAAVEALRDAVDVPTFRRADSEFHIAVADAARNPMLEVAIEDARVAMFLVIDALEFDLLLEANVAAHQRILAAIRDGAASRARKAMMRHLRETQDEFERLLDD